MPRSSDVRPSLVAAHVELEEPAGVASPLAQLLAQQAALAAISQRALAERDLQTLLPEVCAAVARVLNTELVSVSQLEPGGRQLRIIAGVGWRPDVIGQTIPAGDRSQSGYTIRQSGPVVVPDLGSERRFRPPEVLISHDAVAGLSARIGDADRPFGVLAAFSRQRGRFSHDDAQFLQAVANVVAGAITRSSIEEELRHSRDELSAIIGGVSHAIIVLRRDGILSYANEEAARLAGFASVEEMLATPPDTREARYEVIDETGRVAPRGNLPAARALAGESTAEELIRTRLVESGEERWSWARATPIRDADGTVSRVVTIWRDATDQTQEAQDRRFIADATATLYGSLDREEAARRLERLANLVVPALADWCVIDLVQPDGSVEAAAIAHRDPERIALARRVRELRPVSPDQPLGAGKVIREGTPEMAEITPELLDFMPDDEAGQLTRQLGLRWYICVPLVGRSGPIGALSLVTAESGRRLGERELQLAQELGARAGVAVENAMLYDSADERRAELDAVLSAMAEPVLVFSPAGDLRLANPAAHALFEGDVPKSVIDLRAALLPADDQPAPRRSRTLAQLEGEVQLRATGRWYELRRYESARSQADAASRRPPTVIMLRDVTAERAARSAREAFLGLLSHELRTPITTIYAGSEMLERSVDDATRAEVARDIQAEAERLNRLVEDLLVLTRVERGGVEVGDEPVLIQRVLPRLIESLVRRYPGLTVELEVAEAVPSVRGDMTYIEQVLRNLLTNAVRYAEALERGVTTSVAEEDGRVVVRVMDRGPGLGDDEASRVFELFYRAPSARKVPGGAGIGLFVCRHLVEAMGGTMWARQRAGGGAEFGFALPVLEGDPAG